MNTFFLIPSTSSLMEKKNIIVSVSMECYENVQALNRKKNRKLRLKTNYLDISITVLI